jgi:hypothetical protein
MPTTEHDDDEIEDMYDKMDELIEKQKGTDFLVIMGDFNAVVGEGKEETFVGSYGLGKRNLRGERLVEYCREQNLVICNTWFEQPKRRYTWKCPGDTGRYQIDYILVRQRFRNSVQCAKSYPGADCNSDHNLVAAKINVNLKATKKVRCKNRWDRDQFKARRNAFQQRIEERVETAKGKEIECRWTSFKKVVTEAAQDVIGYQKGKKIKKPWITEEMIDKMEERRRYKSINTEEGNRKYRSLNNDLIKKNN